MAPMTRSKIGSVSSFCFFSSSLLYSTKVVLQLDHLLLPVVDLLLQGRLREDARLLVDVLLLLLQVGLPLVELLLAAVEHLLERRLRAQPVLGLHDGALHVDDGHLHLRGRGPAEESHERRDGGCQDEAGERTHGARCVLR